MSKWIQVSALLPPENTPVFISWNGSEYDCEVAIYRKSGVWDTFGEQKAFMIPKYWMLIPSFPKAQQRFKS